MSTHNICFHGEIKQHTSNSYLEPWISAYHSANIFESASVLISYLYIFLFHHENICCGYSLEAPH